MDMTYVDSAKATTLIKISFPPLDNHLDDHEFTLFWSLSFTKAKSLHLKPLMSSGIPDKSTFLLRY